MVKLKTRHSHIMGKFCFLRVSVCVCVREPVVINPVGSRDPVSGTST